MILVDLTSEESKRRLQKKFIGEAQLSFSKILCYTNNERRVLKVMKHYDDEETVDNDFDVVIEFLREKYKADNFFVIDLNLGNAFGIEDIKLVELESLTNREREAFYGRHVQEVLGWILTDLKDRNKNKLLVKIK